MAMNISSLSLLFLVLCLFGRSRADLYGNTAPPPPSAVAGKEFPQSVLCNDPESKCNATLIRCPKQCPTFKPTDPKAKGCYVDCNNAKCEAICKARKPNCNGIGAACYDPRFVGGDGVMFYFHGKTNEHFSLVSDTNLQVNARFVGRRPAGRSRDNTWIQGLGLMFDSHTFTLSANKVAHWDSSVDQLRLTFNGAPVTLSGDDHSAAWSSGGLSVERTAAANAVAVKIAGVLEMSVAVVPVTGEDDRVHNYQIPADDCFAHLEVQFKFLALSEKVDGVLGQTYRPEFKNPVKRGVPMPVMGGEDKFKTTSLLSADCRHCIFSRDGAAEALTVVDVSGMGVNCSTKRSGGRGIVCRR